MSCQSPASRCSHSDSAGSRVVVSRSISARVLTRAQPRSRPRRRMPAAHLRRHRTDLIADHPPRSGPGGPARVGDPQGVGGRCGGQVQAPTRITERSVRRATDRAAMLGWSSRRIADSAVLLRCTESLLAFSHASHCAAGSAPASPDLDDRAGERLEHGVQVVAQRATGQGVPAVVARQAGDLAEHRVDAEPLGDQVVERRDVARARGRCRWRCRRCRAASTSRAGMPRAPRAPRAHPPWSARPPCARGDASPRRAAASGTWVRRSAHDAGEPLDLGADVERRRAAR